jgi:hypothetical protein
MSLLEAMSGIAMYFDRQDRPRDHYGSVSILKVNLTPAAKPESRNIFRSSSKLAAVWGGRRWGIRLARLCHAEKLEMLFVLVVV